MLRRHIQRVCRRQLRSGKLTEKQADAVRAVLKDQLGMDLLTRRVSEMKSLPAASEGERPIIDWLIANWGKILQMILAILAALG